MHPRITLLCATAMLGACSAEEYQPPPMTEITGTASYRERMMLPEGATLGIVLEDVSRADAPAEEIQRTMQTIGAAPPFNFSISVAPGQIVANHRYNIRAKVAANGELLFQSDTAHPVFGPNNILHVDIEMRRATAQDQTALPSRQMRGMYSYMADASSFVDCVSGARLPVAQVGDNAALERAYTNARAMPGAPMLATVEGRLEDRMPMEGDRARSTLIVVKFVSIEAQGCSGPSSQAELENTYWKLMTLDGKPAETPEGAREIHFVLNRERLRFSGFSGCNGISGTYELDGEQIKFTGIAGTLMACTGGMEIERQIQDMFPRVTGWKISGETLQLTDSNGAQISTFESRYLK